ncbi:MAG: hypothetical protein V2A76_04805 [Planctomycetota bacterium]
MWRVVVAVTILVVLALILTRSRQLGDLVSRPGDPRAPEVRDEPGPSPEPGGERAVVFETASDSNISISSESDGVEATTSGTFYGRVVASEGGSPIAGAQVFDRLNPWSEGREPTAVTAGSGDFELPIDQDSAPLWTVTAAGYGPALLRVGDQVTSPESRHLVALHREAVLSGRVLT